MPRVQGLQAVTLLIVSCDLLTVTCSLCRLQPLHPMTSSCLSCSRNSVMEREGRGMGVEREREGGRERGLEGVCVGGGNQSSRVF